MRRIQIAAERADDFLPGVEHDIEDKFQSGFLRTLAHIHMDGVVIEQTGSCTGIVDVGGAVIKHGGGAADYAR